MVRPRECWNKHVPRLVKTGILTYPDTFLFTGVCERVVEFSKFANVIENIAFLIIRDHVRTLGESMEEFPQKRLPELIESLSNEISHTKLKADFLARFTVTSG